MQHNSRTNYRKIHILERKLNTAKKALEDVKADLKVEKEKSTNLENKLNALHPQPYRLYKTKPRN